MSDNLIIFEIVAWIKARRYEGVRYGECDDWWPLLRRVRTPEEQVTWLSPRAFGVQIGMHMQSVRSLIQQGRIPEARKTPGGHYKVPSDSVVLDIGTCFRVGTYSRYQDRMRILLHTSIDPSEARRYKYLAKGEGRDFLSVLRGVSRNRVGRV